jgi:heat shock protein HslJ
MQMKKHFLTVVALAVMIGAFGFTSVIALDASTAFTSYNANEGISRAETAKVLVTYLQEIEGELRFNDRADHMFQCAFTDTSKVQEGETNYIGLACSHGLFKGNQGKFFPLQKLTWAEALALFSRVDKANIQEGTPRRGNYLNHAISRGWLKASDPFTADQSITQEQFATLLTKVTPVESTAPVTPPVATNELANTTWKLLSLNGEDVEGDYVLRFTDTQIGITICNHIGGEYSLTDDTIQGIFAQTDMFCIDNEKNLLENDFRLDGATFSLASTRMISDNIERLAITTTDGDIFLFINIRDEATTDNVTLGGEYGLRTVDGEPVSGTYLLLVTQDTMSIKFCNTMFGNYTLEGDTLQGLLASTMMLCLHDEEAMTLEGKFNVDGARVEVDVPDGLLITTETGTAFQFWQIYR